MNDLYNVVLINNNSEFRFVIATNSINNAINIAMDYLRNSSEYMDYIRVLKAETNGDGHISNEGVVDFYVYNIKKRNIIKIVKNLLERRL